MAQREKPEGQIQFSFGTKNFGLPISDLAPQLKLFEGGPWPEAMSTLASDPHNIDHCGELSTLRADVVLKVFSDSGFPRPATALALIKLACDVNFVEPDPSDVDLDKREAQRAHKRDNAQKLIRYKRTASFNAENKKHIVKVLNLATADLGPTHPGTLISYQLRVELGARLYLVGNFLLKDKSQRHNLDADVKELVARYLDRYFPYQDQDCVQKYETYLSSRWRNGRTGSYQVPKGTFEEDKLDFFDLDDLKKKGHLKEIEEPTEADLESRWVSRGSDLGLQLLMSQLGEDKLKDHELCSDNLEFIRNPYSKPASSKAGFCKKQVTFTTIPPEFSAQPVSDVLMAGSRSNDAGSSVQEGVPVAEPVRPLQQPEQSDMARAMAARRASQASGMANATHPDDLGAGNGSSAPDSSGVSGGAVADEDDDDSDDEKPLTQRMGKTKRDVEADSSDEEGAHVPPQPKKQKGGKGKAAADDGGEKENGSQSTVPKKPKAVGSVAKAFSRAQQEKANCEVSVKELEQGDLNISPKPADFEPSKASKRWVFIPAAEFPDEAKEGLAGWRAKLEKSRQKGSKFEFQLMFKSDAEGEKKMTSAGWFKQEFVEKLLFLSD